MAAAYRKESLKKWNLRKVQEKMGVKGGKENVCVSGNVCVRR
jgi:hypothetical protein